MVGFHGFSTWVDRSLESLKSFFGGPFRVLYLYYELLLLLLLYCQVYHSSKTSLNEQQNTSHTETHSPGAGACHEAARGPWQCGNVLKPAEKEGSVELRKRLKVIILANMPISMVNLDYYLAFIGFLYQWRLQNLTKC